MKSTRKRLWSTILFLVCFACAATAFSACENGEGKMELSTTNGCLDGVEKQLSYQIGSIKEYSLETAYANRSCLCDVLCERKSFYL